MALLKHIPLIAVHMLIYGGLWAVVGSDGTIGTLAFGALLIWVSCRDIAIFEVPDVAVFLLIILGVGTAPDLAWAVGSVLLWAAIFLAVRTGARSVLGQEALGLGDVKLMAGLAAWLGPLAPVYVILYASVSAILTLVALTRVKREKLSDISGTGIAFGPFLCLSAWGGWVWGSGL